MSNEDYAGAAPPRPVRRHSDWIARPGGALTHTEVQRLRRKEEEEWAAKSGPVVVKRKAG